jgi:signal transduction histidine kinase
MTEVRTSSTIGVRYEAALAAFLSGGDEEALLHAYELGRQVMDNGDGVLELTSIHQTAFESLIGPRDGDPGRQLAIERSFEFLNEAMAPFEMAQRGFREANLRLLTANEQLAATNAEIERERANLDAVISSMSEGLLAVDARGVITRANSRAAELLGVAEVSLAGERLPRLAALLDERFGDRALVDDVLTRLRSPSDEVAKVDLRSSAPPCDLLVEIFPLRGQDRYGVGVLIRDVTANRELLRAKDELVAVVSHELRNPLSNIVGFAELLLMDSRGDDEHDEQVGIIVSEARRLTGLIDEFLDVQQFARGAVRIDPEPLEVAAMLARLPAALGGDRTHELVVDAPRDLPQAWADPQRIWQVLVNLVSNARKYSPQGGAIQIRARRRGETVEIAVLDQGLGIDADAMPHLFTEFYRVPTADRRGIPGTGLGLAICRKIVRAHRGEIWAESDGPGCGSRFVFTIPTSAPESS